MMDRMVQGVDPKKVHDIQHILPGLELYAVQTLHNLSHGRRGTRLSRS